MPTIDWNRSWAQNLVHHMKGQLKGEYYGDQWGDPATQPVLQAIKERFIDPFVGPATHCLEIGSGGGRWTQYLKDCERVYCVELNPAMFGYLIDRFNNPKHFIYVTTHGNDFPLVPKSSVDFVFSFGVLVHLDYDVIEGYVRNLVPLLKPGGRISIQFSDKRKKVAAANPDFANTTPDMLRALLSEHGFAIAAIDEESLPHSAILMATH